MHYLMTEFLITYKPLFVILHALAAAVGLGSVVITDTLFFRYLKDFKISRKEEETMETISGIVWVVITLLFLTGLALYFSAPLDYLAKSKFVVKVIIFCVIVLNGVVLSMWLTPVLKKISFGPVEKQPVFKLRMLRRVAFASGVVSAISWLTVFLLGSLRSIPFTVGQGLLFYGSVVLVGIIGSQVYASFVKYGSWAPHVRKD